MVGLCGDGFLFDWGFLLLFVCGGFFVGFFFFSCFVLGWGFFCLFF